MVEAIGSPYVVIVHFGIHFVCHPVSLVICPYRIDPIMCIVGCSVFYILPFRVNQRT